jgi:hypothetical protein
MSNIPLNKTIYKKADQSTTLNRVMKPLSQKHKTQAQQIVSKFITLLKASHN